MQGRRPKLVDYNLIEFPKKQISNIKKKIFKTDHTKLYVNILMIVILLLGFYLLYYRMQNKINIIEENNANILFMSEYINQGLDEMYKPNIPGDLDEELNKSELNRPALNPPALNQTMPASKDLNL
jgi:hypothetical protein